MEASLGALFDEGDPNASEKRAVEQSLGRVAGPGGADHDAGRHDPESPAVQAR
jgi:hypothetical protein